MQYVTWPAESVKPDCSRPLVEGLGQPQAANTEKSNNQKALASSNCQMHVASEEVKLWDVGTKRLRLEASAQLNKVSARAARIRGPPAFG